MAETVYIALGSNIGDREKYIEAAISRLGYLEGIEIVAISGLYISEPEDMVAGAPSFLNQVIKCEYQYTPNELLHALERIELNLGRTGKNENKPRTIDIDILLFGDRQIKTEQLIVPHLKLQTRRFVMIPLLEIDPDLLFPGTKVPIAKSLHDSTSNENENEVVLYKDYVARSI